MHVQEEALTHLRAALETAAGRRMSVPRDFERLSELVFEKVHQKVSSTTLKRLWGYLKEGSVPRESTLDILAQFVGNADWQDFVNTHAAEQVDVPSSDTPIAEQVEDEKVQMSKRTTNRRWLWAVVLPVAVLSLILVYILTRPTRSDDMLVLTKGQMFQSPVDYLSLFGITPTETYWDAPLPHQQGVVVWSPQYHHPHWHNEGNADSLCPTITEYWTPTAAEADTISDVLIFQKNQNLYFTVMRTNELRITFMRGLNSDSTFTFLGIYRVDTFKSDSTHVVWQRIADRLDLAHLDFLQQLRN
ncbi:MAG: hypothetical protein K5778_10210 [Bacteroidaceae bacterium]|nr:hypothetical protein [Bacteroidaceae bacterium]